MIIDNFKKLAITEERESTLKIIQAGLEAINTKSTIRNKIKIDKNLLIIGEKNFLLPERGKVFLVGVGKCALDAVSTLEEILGDKLDRGVILDIRDFDSSHKVRVFKGTHPMPSGDNVKATKEIVRLLEGAGEDDLVIFVISGGGSTLLCLPEDISCDDEGDIVKSLFRSGANIREINTIRKHISLARGGYLAKYAYPARVVSLIFSDVPGDEIQFVASGPTVRDSTTVKEAKEILSKFDILKGCGIKNLGLVETPKEKKYFEKVDNILFISNRVALLAMAEKAKQLGYSSNICEFCLSGEARITGANIAKEVKNHPANSVLLYGGETTVTITGNGKGGRNQELVLGAMEFVGKGEVIASIASDGVDNTDFAGALCDIITKNKASDLNLDFKEYLVGNNSYEFFKKVGDYIQTGPTGSNVSDLVVALKQ